MDEVTSQVRTGRNIGARRQSVGLHYGLRGRLLIRGEGLVGLLIWHHLLELDCERFLQICSLGWWVKLNKACRSPISVTEVS